MAHYQVKERCYIADRLLEVGAVIEHDFPKGKHPPHLAPVKKPAEEADEPSDPSGADGG